MPEKACKTCRRIVKGNICPLCKSSDVTKNWRGLVVVINADSEINNIYLNNIYKNNILSHQIDKTAKGSKNVFNFKDDKSIDMFEKAYGGLKPVKMQIILNAISQ